MDKKLWNLYKSNPEKKKIIEMFYPNADNDIYPNCQQILEYAAQHWSSLPFNSVILNDIDLIEINFQLSFSNLFPKEEEPLTRETYSHIIEEFEIRKLGITADGKVALQNDDKDILLPKTNYRAKASIIPNRSLGPISSGDVKVLSCSPESKECLPLIHGSHKA